jgi:hypothetical protein
MSFEFAPTPRLLPRSIGRVAGYSEFRIPNSEFKTMAAV